MSLRRVVVTGCGLTTPLGIGLDRHWQSLMSSKSGIRVITPDDFDTTDLPVKIAGLVPKGPKESGCYNPLDWMEEKELRRVAPFVALAMSAATQALEDADWIPDSEEDRCRTGVMIGSGIGGLPVIYDTSVTMREKGAKRVSPFFIPSSIINMASGYVSIRYGLKGPNHSVVTACSTGAHAVGDAGRLIMFGDADVMVAGGSECSVFPMGMAAFSASRALSTGFNDQPTKASRPWDRDRDGFVMSDGAAVVILEEYEHAKKRGAKIYAELIGYGLSGDAYHVTAPEKDGDGAFRCMRAALKNAKLNIEDIDYINAHGTSTPLGDEVELRAVKRLFGDHAYQLAMSSTKSSTGHLLGAAGTAEAIFSILAMQHQVAPATLNLDHPSDGCDLNLVAHVPQEKKMHYAMSNSFGFGGTNASLIFAHPDYIKDRD